VFKSNEIPADKWSFLNRLIMYINGTDDARGYRQWQQVNRYVRKGSTAFYILAPMVARFKDTETEEERSMIKGFKAVAAFKIEDTDGEPVITKPYDLKIPCEFDNIIQELGLNVKAVSFGNGGSYGWYAPARKDMRLASPDIEVFLHELAHAVSRQDREDSYLHSRENKSAMDGSTHPCSSMRGWIRWIISTHFVIQIISVKPAEIARRVTCTLRECRNTMTLR
jgi:hypothetical protein